MGRRPATPDPYRRIPTFRGIATPLTVDAAGRFPSCPPTTPTPPPWRNGGVGEVGRSLFPGVKHGAETEDVLFHLGNRRERLDRPNRSAGPNSGLAAGVAPTPADPAANPERPSAISRMPPTLT